MFYNKFTVYFVLLLQHFLANIQINNNFCKKKLENAAAAVGATQ